MVDRKEKGGEKERVRETVSEGGMEGGRKGRKEDSVGTVSVYNMRFHENIQWPQCHVQFMHKEKDKNPLKSSQTKYILCCLISSQSTDIL